MVEVQVTKEAALTRTLVADHVFRTIQDVLKVRPTVRLGLTGGTDGQAITTTLDALLRTVQLPAKSVHIWWSDERFVELDDALRNDLELVNQQQLLGLNEALVIHRCPAPSDCTSIEQAAAKVAEEFGDQQLDVAVIGVGPDGHVASLFPGLWDANEKRSFIGVVNSPKAPAERITMTFEYLKKSAQIFVVATGEAKASAVAQGIAGNTELPVGALISLPNTRLFLDESAASLINNEPSTQSDTKIQPTEMS